MGRDDYTKRDDEDEQRRKRWAYTNLYTTMILETQKQKLITT